MSELALKLIREVKSTKAKKLDLGNCGLTELPDELFELVWLEELYLCRRGLFFNLETQKDDRFLSKNSWKENSIRNFPSEIQKLKFLKILFANGSRSNRWGLKDIRLLKELKNLQILRISYTEINDLSPLKELENLQMLYVSNTNIRDLTSIERLENLQDLEVSSTQVSDLRPLKNLINLNVVSLDDLKIKNFEPLKYCKNLLGYTYGVVK